LAWSRLRYQPAGWSAGERLEPGWHGADPVCADGLTSSSHPCRVTPVIEPVAAPAAATSKVAVPA
jgi:hypothetical protein